MTGKEKGISKEEMNSLNEILDQLEDNELSHDFRQPVDYVGFGLIDYPKIIKNPMDLSTVRRKIDSFKYFSTQEVLKDIQLIWDNCKTYNADGSEIYKLAVKLEKFSKRIIDKIFKNTSNVEKKGKDKKEKRSIVSNINVKSLTTENELNQGINNQEEFKESSEIINTQKEELIKKQNNNAFIEKRSEVKNDDLQLEDEDENPEDSLHVNAMERERLADRVKRLANDGLASLVRLIQKECPSCIEDLDEEQLKIHTTSIDRKTYEQMNQLINTFLKVRETNQENLENKRIKEKLKDY